MTNATQWSIQSDCICLPNGRAILSVDAIGGETEAEVKDNIAVIAAAPETAAERDKLKAINAELLASLKELARHEAFSDSSWFEAVSRASAVIAKATQS